MTIETMTRIPHDGGENPVREGETLVRLWMRGGYEDPAWLPAAQLRWAHTGSGTDIIAYAVTPERTPSPPAKAPTMDAVEAVTDAQALAALRDEMVAAIRDIRAEKGFAGGTEYFGGDDLSQWEREVIADRLLSIVTREANFAGDRALSAARPFFAAECAKVAEKFGDDAQSCLDGIPDIRDPARAATLGNIAAARVIAARIEETIR